MTKIKQYTSSREEALECLYSTAVRLASLRMMPYANEWAINRALEELEIFTHEVQRHNASGEQKP